MGLMERARERSRERKAAAKDLRADKQRHDADRAVVPIRRILELDPESFGPDRLTCLTNDWDRNLFAFTLDGLEFVAGSYWTGSPGDDFLLAVRVRKRKPPKPEWPPPSPRSASNCRWAPEGYKAIHSLADLGDLLATPSEEAENDA